MKRRKAAQTSVYDCPKAEIKNAELITNRSGRATARALSRRDLLHPTPVKYLRRSVWRNLWLAMLFSVIWVASPPVDWNVLVR